MGRGFQRSESTGSIADNTDTGLLGLRVAPATPGVGKLPALLIPPKIAASLDNCELMRWNCSFTKTFIGPICFDSCPVSEGMPPRKDFRQPRDTNEAQDGHLIGDAPEPMDRMLAIREHPMKKMQAKSHDGHGITLSLQSPANPLKLNRSNDLLAQSSTETLLDMLKAHAGIKDCSEETEKHINGVS